MSIKTLLVVGCIFSACARPPAHVRCTDDVTNAYSKSQKDLVCIGRGGYFGNKCITGLYIDFEVERVYSNAEAKELLLKTVEEFITHANRSETLTPFLKKHPITFNEVSLSIAFVDKGRKPQPLLAQIHLYEGRIYYSNFDPAKKAYIAFSQESYPAPFLTK